MATPEIKRYSEIRYVSSANLSHLNAHCIMANAGNNYRVSVFEISKDIVRRLRNDQLMLNTVTLTDGLKPYYSIDKMVISLDYSWFDSRYVKKTFLAYDYIHSDNGGQLFTIRPHVGTGTITSVYLNHSGLHLYLDGRYIRELPPTNGRAYEVNITRHDNGKVYIYAEKVGRNINIYGSHVYSAETRTKTMIGVINRPNDNVAALPASRFNELSVQSFSYSRLGPWRVNKDPRGTSAPSSRGSAANIATSYWMMDDY